MEEGTKLIFWVDEDKDISVPYIPKVSVLGERGRKQQQITINSCK